MVIELELGKSAWAPGVTSDNTPVVEDTAYVNIQIANVSDRKLTLSTKLIWDSPRQLNDLDLFMYDRRGQRLEKSDRPTGQPQSQEFVSVPARRCEGFTAEVRGYRTLDTSATLRIWLTKGE